MALGYPRPGAYFLLPANTVSDKIQRIGRLTRSSQRFGTALLDFAVIRCAAGPTVLLTNTTSCGTLRANP
jgi:hypothetical protein